MALLHCRQAAGFHHNSIDNGRLGKAMAFTAGIPLNCGTGIVNVKSEVGQDWSKKC